MRQHDLLARRVAQGPQGFFGCVAQPQRGQVQQVLRCGGRRGVGQQSGRGHQQVRACSQGFDGFFCRQYGIGLAHTQGKVHAAFPHINRPVGGPHTQLDLRPGIEHARQHVAHGGVQQGRRA